MNICKKCNGTGVDLIKQREYEKTLGFRSSGGTIMCWTCNGNGLEPWYPGDYERYLKAKKEGRI